MRDADQNQKTIGFIADFDMAVIVVRLQLKNTILVPFQSRRWRLESKQAPAVTEKYNFISISEPQMAFRK